jgi:hypothetical protein
MADETSVTAEAWAELKSLPERLKALEEKAAGAVGNADLLDKIAEFETKLQEGVNYIQNLNSPTRIQALEAQLAQIKQQLGKAAPAPPATQPPGGQIAGQGTAAQRTPAPAAPKAT